MCIGGAIKVGCRSCKKEAKRWRVRVKWGMAEEEMGLVSELMREKTAARKWWAKKRREREGQNQSKGKSEDEVETRKALSG